MRMSWIIRVIAASALLITASGLGGNDDIGGASRLYSMLDSAVTDYDGNVYRTVEIGSQIWMVENLRVTHYRNGIPIPNVQDNEEWPHASDGAYCMVDDDSLDYRRTYGLLYNYHAVANENMLCPEGWHVPSEAECMILIEYVGGMGVAGGKIKDNSSHLWINDNTVATNESGFSGLPAGGRGQFGGIGEIGYYATWWSSTSSDSLYAWHWGLYPDKAGIRCNPGHKASGFSVRCIKD